MPFPSSGIVQRYRADQGITLDGNGNVTQWNDISGGGRNLIRRDTGAGGPVVATPSAIAGQRAVDFRRVDLNDRNGIMFAPNYFGATIPSNITIALVAYLDGSASDGNGRGSNDLYWTAISTNDAIGTSTGYYEVVMAMQWSTTSPTHPNPVLASDGGLLGEYYADYGTPSPWPVYLPNQLHDLLASYAAGDPSPILYSDGGATGVSLGTRHPGVTHIGIGGANGFRRYFQGFIAEVIFWDRALTSQDRTDWNTYVHQRYVLGYADAATNVSSVSSSAGVGIVVGVQSQIIIVTGVTATCAIYSVTGANDSAITVGTLAGNGSVNTVYAAASHPTQLLGPAFITASRKSHKKITSAIQRIRHVLQHHTYTKHITVVSNAVHHITQYRVGIDGFLQELLDVNTTAIPAPYPTQLIFEQDKRYKLVYDPAQLKWIAALEPVITSIDGGTY